MNTDYDIAIVGGGIIGLLTCLALTRTNHKIIHIEKNPLEVKDDNRNIAVSYSSIAFLNTLGLWDKFKSSAEIIKKVHISDKGKYGRAEIFAKDENLPFLGAMIPMRKLLDSTLHAVAKQQHITKSFKTNVIDLKYQDNEYSLFIDDGVKKKDIKAKLIIACDGANSSIRKMLNITAKSTDYKQDALVFDIQTTLQHNNTVFERFLSDGVLAMLPKSNTTIACVWTVDRESSKSKLSLTRQQLEKLIQDKFGYRLGQIKLDSKVLVFPLQLVQTDPVYTSNVLFFGNALHFLHPVSGQGMNLSIRDIGFLYDLLIKSDFSPQSLHNSLQKFSKTRKPDHDRIIHLTHSFISWFVSNDPKLVASRNISLHLLQRSKIAKSLLSKVMMGKFSEGSTLMRKVIE